MQTFTHHVYDRARQSGHIAATVVTVPDGDRVIAAIAIASPKDQASRRVGRKLATTRVVNFYSFLDDCKEEVCMSADGKCRVFNSREEFVRTLGRLRLTGDASTWVSNLGAAPPKAYQIIFQDTSE